MESLAYAQKGESAGEADRDLVTRARSGEQDAFAEIVREYQRMVYGMALRMTRRHEVADDVVQETFIRAYRNLHRFDLGRPLGPWLTKIAVNLSLNYLNGVRRRREEPYITEEQPDGPSRVQREEEREAVETDPLRRLLSSEFATALEGAIQALTPEHRAVFVLKVEEGMRYEQIAEALGISRGTVMSRLHRARARLKKMLREYL